MSSGVVHTKACIILSAAFVGTAILTGRHEFFECAIGSMTGILISPDLDVDAKNISTAIIKKRTGWFGAKLWDMLWHNYRLSFKHGRFASHFPIFGTFVRLAYIYFVFVIPAVFIWWFYIQLESNYNLNLIQELKWWFILLLRPAFFYGLASADFVHYGLDIFTTNGE